MRIFTGFFTNNDTKSKINEYIDFLKEKSVSGNFTHFNNIHLTLIFLGEINDRQYKSLVRAVENVEFSPFEIQFDQIGKFEGKRGEKGDLYWIGADKNDELNFVYKSLKNEIMKEKLTFDAKTYKPHITIGRQVILKNSSEELCKKITPINFKIDKINIIKSEKTLNGMKYVKLM